MNKNENIAEIVTEMRAEYSARLTSAQQNDPQWKQLYKAWLRAGGEYDCPEFLALDKRSEELESAL